MIFERYDKDSIFILFSYYFHIIFSDKLKTIRFLKYLLKLSDRGIGFRALLCKFLWQVGFGSKNASPPQKKFAFFYKYKK